MYLSKECTKTPQNGLFEKSYLFPWYSTYLDLTYNFVSVISEAWILWNLWLNFVVLDHLVARNEAGIKVIPDLKFMNFELPYHVSKALLLEYFPWNSNIVIQFCFYCAPLFARDYLEDNIHGFGLSCMNILTIYFTSPF